MDPRQPRLFETLTLPNIAARCFVVRVADDQIRPDTVPAAGTAYNAATNKLPNRILQDIWGSYVYGWPIEAPTDYSAFAFVPALPTTPTVKPRIDATWGPVVDHTYYCLRSSTQLDVADTGATIAILGASYSSHHVIEVRPPREMSGEVIEVTVTTSANNTVTQTDKPVDLGSGALYTRTRTWTVADSNPTGSAPNTSGEYTLVTQQSYKTWLSVTDRSSTLPNTRASAITWDSHDKMYWPAVRQSYEFLPVRDESSNRFRNLLTANMRSPYSGDCKVTSRLWWQSTAYTIPEVDAMIPSAVMIRGNLENYSLPEALHSGFEYNEQNYLAPLSDIDNPNGGYVIIQFAFQPTSKTDWPETFVSVRQRFTNGGFEVLEETYYRPQNYNVADSTVLVRPWAAADGMYYDT